MEDHHIVKLSRRERQIMDVIHQRGRASVADVLGDLPDPPSYSAVRALLRIMEGKGHLKHEKDGAKYIYSAVASRQIAGRSALKQVLQTFFDKSVEKTVAALLDISDSEISDEELERLTKLLEQAKRGESP